MIQAIALRPYIELTRLHKPIGIFLLMWPTCWALWLAAGGMPPLSILLIFLSGVVLMRSAGCIINDVFDRHIDRHVERTRSRPLARGVIKVRHAVMLAAVLALLAFILVMFCNHLTILLSFAGAFFAVTYPLLKRITHLPQLGLGVAFSWGVPMAFAAVSGEITSNAWLIFTAALLWPVIYDTMYAMADRADDVKIGVKSTAILFGKYDVFILACLMIGFLALLTFAGMWFDMNRYFYITLLITGALFVRQLWMIRHRDPAKCFHAFLQNNLIGLVIFIGFAVGQYG